jgi:hypothetical protein
LDLTPGPFPDSLAPLAGKGSFLTAVASESNPLGFARNKASLLTDPAMGIAPLP